LTSTRRQQRQQKARGNTDGDANDRAGASPRDRRRGNRVNAGTADGEQVSSKRRSPRGPRSKNSKSKISASDAAITLDQINFPARRGRKGVPPTGKKEVGEIKKVSPLKTGRRVRATQQRSRLLKERPPTPPEVVKLSKTPGQAGRRRGVRR
jgi:hypothetical protein